MMPRCLPLFLTAIAFIFAPGAVQAGSTLNVPTNTDASLRIETWFEHVPPSGFMPVSVHMVNFTDRPLSWTISTSDTNFMSGSMSSSFTVGAAPKASARADLLLPVFPRSTSGYMSHSGSQIVVSGSALSTGSWRSFLSPASVRSSGSRTTKSPAAFMAMSASYNTAAGTQTVEQVKNQSAYEWAGDTVNMQAAPADWRGYSALALLLMTESDWTTLSSAQRAALLSWIAHGGDAIVLVDAAKSSLPLADTLGAWRDGALPHGSGSLNLLRKDQISDPKGLLRMFLDANKRSFQSRALLEDGVNTGSSSNGLAGLVPQLTINGTLIFAFILIFGVLVGPVNLFVFARGAHRPRLFWTTPLISALGTLVLIAVMIMQDGFGGTGARITLATIQPGQKEITAVQEQFSKTGVLLSRGFSSPAADRALVTPVPLTRESTSSFRTYSIRSSEKRDYTYSNDVLTGNWFSSRSLQRQLVQSTRSTRGTIEFAGGANPSILSSLGMTLKTIYVTDGAEKIWRADNVHTGERAIMKPATKVEMQQWWRDAAQHHCGNLLQDRFTRLMQDPRTMFFAESAEPEKLASPTLTSIRWTQDRAFVAGPVEGSK